MNCLSENKYKDELPLNTIKKIKSILQKLGIYTIEDNWKNSVKGFYSVRVTIKETTLGTNGKGTTPVYALASAYGELMERLQNQSFFKLSIDVSDECFKYKGFYYAPDEKPMTTDEFLNSNDDWTKYQLSSSKKSINRKTLMKKWQNISYEKTPYDFISLPYININNNKLSYIPIKMISKMYMSNGMCAGNSPEEALVQGMSEIFERYVNIKIIKEKINPPNVPSEYIKKYPKIYSMIESLQSSGKYKVLVKDCSLEKSLPVVCVILINRQDKTYFLKFGCHPAVEIALERTLTELLQGQDIKKMIGSTPYSYNPKNVDSYNNLLGILTTGGGTYHSNIFTKKFSYKFKGFIDNSNLNNKEMLKYLIDLLKENGYDTFIRDASYLNIPAYHIIVPGFSEIEPFDFVESLDKYSKFINLKKVIRNINSLDNNKIKKTLDYIKEDKDYNPFVPVTKLISTSIDSFTPWYYSTLGLFLAACYYKIGDFKNSYEQMDIFINASKFNYPNLKLYNYYKCVRDYIGCKAANLSFKDTINSLNTFYSKSMMKSVIKKFRNHENIFSYFGCMTCWNCSKCIFKNTCSYKKVEKIYKILKNQSSISNIHQENLRKLLD